MNARNVNSKDKGALALLRKSVWRKTVALKGFKDIASSMSGAANAGAGNSSDGAIALANNSDMHRKQQPGKQEVQASDDAHNGTPGPPAGSSAAQDAAPGAHDACATPAPSPPPPPVLPADMVLLRSGKRHCAVALAAAMLQTSDQQLGHITSVCIAKCSPQHASGEQADLLAMGRAVQRLSAEGALPSLRFVLMDLPYGDVKCCTGMTAAALTAGVDYIRAVPSLQRLDITGAALTDVQLLALAEATAARAQQGWSPLQLVVGPLQPTCSAAAISLMHALSVVGMHGSGQGRGLASVLTGQAARSGSKAGVVVLSGHAGLDELLWGPGVRVPGTSVGPSLPPNLTPTQAMAATCAMAQLCSSHSAATGSALQVRPLVARLLVDAAAMASSGPASGAPAEPASSEAAACVPANLRHLLVLGSPLVAALLAAHDVAGPAISAMGAPALTAQNPADLSDGDACALTLMLLLAASYLPSLSFSVGLYSSPLTSRGLGLAMQLFSMACRYGQLVNLPFAMLPALAPQEVPWDCVVRSSSEAHRLPQYQSSTSEVAGAASALPPLSLSLAGQGGIMHIMQDLEQTLPALKPRLAKVDLRRCGLTADEAVRIARLLTPSMSAAGVTDGSATADGGEPPAALPSSRLEAVHLDPVLRNAVLASGALPRQLVYAGATDGVWSMADAAAAEDGAKVRMSPSLKFFVKA